MIPQGEKGKRFQTAKGNPAVTRERARRLAMLLPEGVLWSRIKWKNPIKRARTCPRRFLREEKKGEIEKKGGWGIRGRCISLRISTVESFVKQAGEVGPKGIPTS